jgi:hypothetical protein
MTARALRNRHQSGQVEEPTENVLGQVFQQLLLLLKV